MEFQPVSISCGASQAFGISQDQESNLRDFSDQVAEGYDAFIIFSDTVGTKKYPSNGTLFAAALKEKIKSDKIGSLTQSPVRTNPNSGNRIRVWTFAVNPAAIGKWFTTKEKKK